MELVSTSFTPVFAFVLGFVIYKSYDHLNRHTRSILSKLYQLCSKILEFFCFESGCRATAAKILSETKVELLDRYQIEKSYKAGTWQRKAYDDFTGALISEDKVFPCIYGTKGYKANELDFLFLDSEDLNDLENAKFGAKAILEYHKILKDRGRNVSLVLLCPPPTVDRSVQEYHKLFWSFLKRLRQLDPKPWPAKIPHNTSDCLWCMNFDGMEAFFAVQTPAHKQRISRYAPNFALIYQPRIIFDVVFKNPRYRESAIKTVRGLVDKYDKIPHSPDISNYAVDGITESRQYFLLDKNEPAYCPYDSLDMAASSSSLLEG